MPVAAINTMIPWGFVRPVPPPRPFGAIHRVGTVSIGPMWAPVGQIPMAVPISLAVVGVAIAGALTIAYVRRRR